MKEQKETTSSFHCFWVYDLFIEADEIEEDFLQVQYLEIGIDVESPPEFHFWNEEGSIKESIEWFGLILDFAFDIPLEEGMDYEYIPIDELDLIE